ncbi:phosphodiesterase [Uliginosibacterium sp. H3]|uniref:Phosphodiesterase n=1 Tax=Uliginosibacterium silvisoli TaxID=3114758 RepID=A0ABU6K4E6_9RHOO|nr:phosphodiesterase [Uliginosibacterium sp. H3]
MHPDSTIATSVTTAAEDVSALIADNALTAVFQPLINLAESSFFGFESLVRGPQDSALRNPDNLFAAAEREGCVVELELHCCRIAIREFAREHASGKLLMNMSPRAVLGLSEQQREELADYARRMGILPSRLIIELTEHDRVAQPHVLKAALAPWRKAGMLLALDDFGDGKSSLRAWTELRPDLVKIDKHFVKGVHADNERFEVLRVLKHISETFGGKLVAEGIEDEADLAVLRDMGIMYGQGYLLGRPQAQPARELPRIVLDILQSSQLAVFPDIRVATHSSLTAETLIASIAPVGTSTTNNDLAQRFREQPGLHALAIVSDDLQPLGLINRQAFMDRYAQPFHKELYGRKSCTTMMNAAPLVIEQGTPLMSLVDVLRGDDQRYLVDGFIISHEGRYAGLGTGERLVRAVSELRIEAARHANPLTALPGNIPISEHIDRLLRANVEFVACYCDLRHFKPFNDCYGYWRGDEMIRMVAGLLMASCDPLRDFVGHVGGDDFIMLMQSDDWEERCRAAIVEFAERSRALFDNEARERGGIDSEDRHGNPCFFPLSSLIIGVVRVRPGRFGRAKDVATAAAASKRAAKHEPGGFFMQDPSAATGGGGGGGSTTSARHLLTTLHCPVGSRLQ